MVELDFILVITGDMGWQYHFLTVYFGFVDLVRPLSLQTARIKSSSTTRTTCPSKTRPMEVLKEILQKNINPANPNQNLSLTIYYENIKTNHEELPDTFYR